MSVNGGSAGISEPVREAVSSSGPADPLRMTTIAKAVNPAQREASMIARHDARLKDNETHETSGDRDSRGACRLPPRHPGTQPGLRGPKRRMTLQPIKARKAKATTSNG